MKNQVVILGTVLALSASLVNSAAVGYLANYCQSCLSPDDNLAYYFCGADNQCYDASSDVCSSGLISHGSECTSLPSFASTACSVLTNIPAGNEVSYDLTISPQ